MNNIQKLISELEVEKEKATAAFVKAPVDTRQEYYDRGRLDAFSFIIQKLHLLLKEETAKDLPEEKCGTCKWPKSQCQCHLMLG